MGCRSPIPPDDRGRSAGLGAAPQGSVSLPHIRPAFNSLQYLLRIVQAHVSQRSHAQRGFGFVDTSSAYQKAGLTKEPQFGMREIDALGESNYQLLAIGRNLNQIAKRLNEGGKGGPTVGAIEQLRAGIKAHTDQVSRAMRASLERWDLE